MKDLLDKIASIWSKLNKRMVIIVASCVAIICSGLVAVGVYANSPKVVAARSVIGFVDDFTERDELSTILSVLKKGSIEASMSKLEVDGENLMQDISLSGKLYMSKDAYMLEDIHIKTKDFNVTADIYASYDLFYIEEDSILGGAYGITPKDFAGDLEESIFAYGSGSEYEIPDKDLYESLLKFAESLDQSKKMSKDMQKLGKQIAKDIYKIVLKHADIESENDKEKIGGDKMNVRVVTIKINEKMVANILKDVYKYLKDDKKIPKFIDKYDDYLSYSLSISQGNIEKPESASDMYKDLLDSLEETIDETCDSIKSTDLSFKIELVTPRGSSKLLKINLSSNGSNIASVDFGAKGIKKSNKITVDVLGNEVAEYRVSKNNNKAYSAVLEVSGEKILSISVDKKDKEFDISLYIEGETVEISGGLSKSGLFKKTTTIEVEKIQIGDYRTMELDLTIKLTEGDKVPKPPKDCKTIRDITEKDIDKWIENVEELIDFFDGAQRAPESNYQ